MKHRFLCPFRSQLTSETVFIKSKNTDVCVILSSKWQQRGMLVLTIEINRV